MKVEENEIEMEGRRACKREKRLVSTSREKENDPIWVLGKDLMIKVFGYVDARSLTLSLLVSRSWLSLASSDILWSPLCEQLWVGKAHIPRRSKRPGLSKLACYSCAMIDSKRLHITREDLWDHAWNFHFTEAAPVYWKSLDPYWNARGPILRRYFHPDGTLTGDEEDKVWGGHECWYTVVTSVIISTGKIRKNYVRVNRWPCLVVSRREDWGWNMSNVIFAYSSIPDSEKKDGTGPLY